jgi:hypothetical protein
MSAGEVLTGFCCLCVLLSSYAVQQVLVRVTSSHAATRFGTLCCV